MLFDDTYKTISSPVEGLFKDKGSKFIAYAYPLSNEEEVKPHLLKLRAEHSKAVHFCYAYRLTPDRSVFRVNDDGEPSGTAGRPILNTLLSADITNILVVVVRYFGGTLLGVPGLINAYKTATVEALQQATVVQKSISDIYEINFDYLMMNDVMRLMKEEQLVILDQQFDNRCQIRFEIKQSKLNKVLARLEQQLTAELKYLYTV